MRALRPTLLAAILGAIGCAPTVTTVLSLQDAPCRSCGESTVRTLRSTGGVEAATFDPKAVEITVLHDPERIEAQGLMSAIDSEEYGVVVGAGKGSYASGPTFPSDLDVAWINKAGEDVDPTDHLVPGKITVVDFFAEWCGPCKDVDQALIELLRRRPDVAVRKIDVDEWDSDVAKSRLKEVKALPYTVVYGPTGDRRDAIAGKDLERLRAAIGPEGSP